MREQLQNDYNFYGHVTRKVVRSCQTLMRKALDSHWQLRILLSPICCLFSKFQWILYDVYHLIYHPTSFIAQEHIWINCQIELSTRLMMA